MRNLLRRSGLPALFGLAVLLVRLPVLLAYQGTWYPFEIFSGTVATALLDGLDLDVAHLYIISHIRGGALFGVLLVPLYALLGASSFALKLLPLLWHAATVALLVAVLRRAFGRSAATGTGLILLCAPPLYAKLSVLGLASHMEATLPITAALFLFFSLRSGSGGARGRLLLFGLVLGFSAFFHMQALLACLILLALLVVEQPRICLRGAPLLVLGIALGVAPSLLFEGGDWSFTSFAFGSKDTRTVVPSGGLGDSEHAASYYGFWPMTRALLTEGLGPILEFGHLGPRLGPFLAHVYGIALLLAVGWALLRERRGLLGLLQRLLLRPASVSPVAFFCLHSLAVLALLMASNLALNFWAVGSGMEGRRLAPLLYSLLVLGGIGVAAGPSGRRTPLAWGILWVLCATGAAGTLAASRSSPADRLVQRGECSEFFPRWIEHHASRRPLEILETLTRIDRGDPRFATLRFSVNLGLLAGLTPELQVQRARGLARAATWGPWLLTAAGRAVGGDRRALLALRESNVLAGLTPGERAAFLHGVGLDLQNLLGRTEEVPSLLDHLARSLPREDAGLVFEGYGFAQGLVYDSFNSFQRRRLYNFRGLAASVRPAFYRGFGWGHRQRYREPPVALPEGLGVLAMIPEEARESFVEAWLGRVLPPEAISAPP